MTALATASRVLAWAAGSPGSPPIGGVEDAGRLMTPGPEVCERLRQLARYTAARLGAGRPPLGDDGPVGLGTVLIAAAIGGRRDPDAACQIIRAVPPRLTADPVPHGDGGAGAPGWSDAIARHGIASRFADPGQEDQPRATADAALVDCLLDASPLTTVLLRPSSERLRTGTIGAQLAIALQLLTRPRGRELLTSALAAPTRDLGVLTWRAYLLTRLSREHRDVVLGVYLAARLRYGPKWDELLDWAARRSGAPTAALQFWTPLAILDREDRALLPSQPFLEGYRRAVDLGGRYMTTMTS